MSLELKLEKNAQEGGQFNRRPSVLGGLERAPGHVITRWKECCTAGPAQLERQKWVICLVILIHFAAHSQPTLACAAPVACCIAATRVRYLPGPAFSSFTPTGGWRMAGSCVQAGLGLDCGELRQRGTALEAQALEPRLGPGLAGADVDTRRVHALVAHAPPMR